MNAARTRKGKGLLWLIIIILLAGVFILYKTFGPNTGSLLKGEFLYIRTGSTYNDVLRELEQGGYLRDIASFNLLAKMAKYPAHVRARVDKHR
jgi:UPF0755 protein